MGSSLGVLLQLLGSGMRAGSQLGLHGALGCGLVPRGSRLPCALLSAIPQGRCGIRPSLGHNWVGHLDPSPPAVTAPSPVKQRGSQEQLGAVESFLLCSWGSGSHGGPARADHSYWEFLSSHPLPGGEVAGAECLSVRTESSSLTPRFVHLVTVYRATGAHPEAGTWSPGGHWPHFSPWLP